MIVSMPIWLWRLLIALVTLRWSNAQHLCSVFQPFRVTPENAKFQIGGPFPLHMEDCLQVRPDVVQELIGIQWALSHWNQNPKNANCKLALSAFDTCSRGQESLSQTMTFLQESGYFNSKECRSFDGAHSKIPLGLVMPMAQDGRLKGLKEALMGFEVPIITYSGSTAQALLDAQIPTIFSTAPMLDHFMEAAIGVLKSIQSDLIELVFSDSHVTKSTLDKQISTLSKSGIFISKISAITDTKWADNSTEIIVLIASKDESIEYFMTYQSMNSNRRKLFILIPALGEIWTRADIADFILPSKSSYRLIIVQQGGAFLEDDFRAYFLDILRNNYQSYALLAKYMQQEHNCTLIGTEGLIDCEDVEIGIMMKRFVMSRRVESAVLATYVYGALAKHIMEHQNHPCVVSGSDELCIRKIQEYLKDDTTYTFGDFDPPSYHGFVSKFGPDRSLNSLPIQGLYVSYDSVLRMESIFNHSTGTRMDLNGVRASIIRDHDGHLIKSKCKSWKSECQSCPDEKKYPHVSDQLWMQKKSDLYIMGMFDMRKGLDSNSIACNRSIDDPKSISMPAAFAYVLENIRRKHPQFMPNLEMSGLIMDSCHDHVSSLEILMAISADRCLVVNETDTVSSSVPSKNMAAFVSGQRGLIGDTVKRLIHQKRGAPRKPFISSDFETTQYSVIHKNDHDFMQSFAPDYEALARVLMSVLLKHNWEYISVIISEHDEDCMKRYESFRRLVDTDARICIGDVIFAKSGDRVESIRNANSPNTRISVAFTTSQDTILILKTLQSYRAHSSDGIYKPIYVFMGDAHDWEIDAKSQSGAHTWKSLALGSLSVQFKRTMDDDFRRYLSNMTPKSIHDRWFIDFWQDYFKCSLKDSPETTHKKHCTGDERFPIDKLGGRFTREAYFTMAIENFMLALDKFYKMACPAQDGLCDAFFADYENVTEFMPKMDRQDEFVVYNYKPNVDHVNGGVYVEIATWSPTDGLKFNGTVSWYDSERNANNTIPESTCRPPHCHCKQPQRDAKKPRHSSAEALLADQSVPTSENRRVVKPRDENEADTVTANNGPVAPATGEQWRKQLWAYIFLIINSILLLASVLVLTVVSVKLCCGVVKGNQSLGICLLFGVILLYTTAYFFIFDACEMLCRLRYIAHSLSYSVCFGVMIAKAVQLRNSETLGFNGYISYWNYWLLLFFIVAVQLALNLQWAIVRQSVVVSMVDDAGSDSATVVLRCTWTNDEFLASQIYVIVLLCMASCLALMNRNVKRNYKETRWLMYTSFICAGIWACWMIGYAFTPEPFKDTVVVMELMTCATVVLCFMFGPKLYILLKYESILNDFPTISPKLPNGPMLGAGAIGEIEKRHSIALGGNKDDVGIHHFDADDILDHDGRISAMSGGSGKSATTLSHTLSSASSTSNTGSEDSTTPVLKIGMRKKSRGKTRNPPSGSIEEEAKNRSHSTIFEETVSSVH